MEKEYFAHTTAIIDEGCKIGKGAKIWHFSHIMLTSYNCGKIATLGQKRCCFIWK